MLKQKTWNKNLLDCVCVCVKHLLLQRSGGEMCGDTGRIGSPPCGVLGSITLRSLGLGINLALGVVMVSQFGSTGFGSKHPYGSSVPLSSDFPKHYKYMVGRHTYRKSIHTHKVSGWHWLDSLFWGPPRVTIRSNGAWYRLNLI